MSNLKKFLKKHKLPSIICLCSAVCLLTLAVYFLFIKDGNDYESLADSAI